MPESGTMPYVMYFEPLDKEEQSFDYMEDSESENGNYFYGIKTNKTPSNAPVQCLIRGEVIDRPNSNRLMLLKEGGDARMSSIYIPIIDGKFEYQLNVNVEETYDLIFVDEDLNGAWRPITFFAENGTVSMKLYPMDRHLENVIEGGLLNKKYADHKKLRVSLFQEGWDELRKEWYDLYEKGTAESPAAKEINKLLGESEDGNVRDSLYRCLDALQKTKEHLSEEGKALDGKSEIFQRKQLEWELDVLNNNVSLVNYAIIAQNLLPINISHNPLGPDPYIELYNNIYKELYPKHPYTEKINIYVNSLTNMKVGGKYIDFSAPDFNGNPITLSEQIKGKVSLIDLWASWCGPCRRHSMNMIPVYEAYKDKGFTIVGVARESELSSAVNAAKKDGYPWINLIELNDRNKIWEMYGVGNAAGSTFLVDRDGTILAIRPTAKEVEEILENKLK